MTKYWLDRDLSGREDWAVRERCASWSAFGDGCCKSVSKSAKGGGMSGVFYASGCGFLYKYSPQAGLLRG